MQAPDYHKEPTLNLSVYSFFSPWSMAFHLATAALKISAHHEAGTVGDGLPLPARQKHWHADGGMLKQVGAMLHAQAARQPLTVVALFRVCVLLAQLRYHALHEVVEGCTTQSRLVPP